MACLVRSPSARKRYAAAAHAHAGGQHFGESGGVRDPITLTPVARSLRAAHRRSNTSRRTAGFVDVTLWAYAFFDPAFSDPAFFGTAFFDYAFFDPAFFDPAFFGAGACVASLSRAKRPYSAQRSRGALTGTGFWAASHWRSRSASARRWVSSRSLVSGSTSSLGSRAAWIESPSSRSTASCSSSAVKERFEWSTGPAELCVERSARNRASRPASADAISPRPRRAARLKRSARRAQGSQDLTVEIRGSSELFR